MVPIFLLTANRKGGFEPVVYKAMAWSIAAIVVMFAGVAVVMTVMAPPMTPTTITVTSVDRDRHCVGYTIDASVVSEDTSGTVEAGTTGEECPGTKAFRKFSGSQPGEHRNVTVHVGSGNTVDRIDIGSVV